MVSNPKISVLICAFNRKKFLGEAIESVLRQDLDRSHFEIVVVKNFKDSHLDEIIDEGKISNVFCEKELLGEFLFTGIKACSGDYIAFLDDDDMWTPERLKRIYNISAEYPDLGYYHNMVSPIDESGSPPTETRIYERIDPSRHTGSFGHFDSKGKIRNLKALFSAFPDFNNSSVVVRKEIVLQVSKYFRRIPQSLDSFIFFSALSSNCSIFLDYNTYTLYRHHGENITGTLDSGDEETWRANRSSMLKFLETYGIILEMTGNLGVGESIRAARRRYYFTALLSDLVIQGSGKKRMMKTSVELLKVFTVYQSAMNVVAIILAIIYYISPKISILIVRRALSGRIL